MTGDKALATPSALSNYKLIMIPTNPGETTLRIRLFFLFVSVLRQSGQILVSLLFHFPVICVLRFVRR